MKLILLFLTMLCGSCGNLNKSVSSESVIRDSVYIQKLVPVALPADTAEFQALFRCDSLGKVYISNIRSLTTENIAMKFKLDSIGNLEQQVVVRHDTLFLPETYSELKSIRSSSENKVYGHDKSVYIYLLSIILFLLLSLIVIIRTFR